jgi:hypothetical protein
MLDNFGIYTPKIDKVDKQVRRDKPEVEPTFYPVNSSCRPEDSRSKRTEAG